MSTTKDINLILRKHQYSIVWRQTDRPSKLNRTGLMFSLS
ncbi:hypothetical protein KL86DYS2_10930 [uncultured Dysgonomonas sp.]|uniref:Uncharacterized protein n=1 Tax=uncultured Dysgonomonas sp. TaxID=206096 RepID=A0A212J7Y2_9BACT|nr:hypothetical protein KL86DYS2_10930 [uncultured Dysgonomonas sp.]